MLGRSLGLSLALVGCVIGGPPQVKAEIRGLDPAYGKLDCARAFRSDTFTVNGMGTNHRNVTIDFSTQCSANAPLSITLVFPLVGDDSDAREMKVVETAANAINANRESAFATVRVSPLSNLPLLVATSGTVKLTREDPTGVEGTFTAKTSGGQEISGTFAAAF